MPYTNDGTPFARGSETSQMAAESVKTSVVEAKVLAEIRRYGPTGLTCDEIEQVLEMRHQTASARVKGLKDKGLVVESGMRRRTRSRRWADVIVAREFTQRSEGT